MFSSVEHQPDVAITVDEVGGRPLTARARVENVANEDQWVAVGGYPGSNYLTLGAPRTLSLQLAVEF